MPPATAVGGLPFVVTPVTAFDEPWAMTFLPDGSALVTERGGALLLVDPASGTKTSVQGTPDVVVAGQGGLGDVVLAPTFAADRGVYLSWVEAGDGGTSGAVIGRGTLSTGASPRLERLSILWRQEPKVTGQGHFAHRMSVSPDGRHLFVTSGDRQKFDPAQDLRSTLGKVLRLDLDGAAAEGNPFAEALAERAGVAAQIWSAGHRNPLGIAFDEAGNLWVSEMGPRGGDEVNLVQPGRNYGWPVVSNGSHYSGQDIPDHRPGDGFEPPKVSWNPSISPGSLMVYSGELFPAWRGDAFVGALSGTALIRIDLAGTDATLAETWDLGARIREVEQGPDGSIWLLEDGDGGRLLRLTAPR
ncbi:MAG: PQQ-dependent sugar dehydrogenase [Candidatus Phosphoribacter sp.]